MTLAEKIVHYGSLTVNLAVVIFFGWLMYKSEMHSPQTIDPNIISCRVVSGTDALRAFASSIAYSSAVNRTLIIFEVFSLRGMMSLSMMASLDTMRG